MSIDKRHIELQARAEKAEAEVERLTEIIDRMNKASHGCYLHGVIQDMKKEKEAQE